ncbi:MAG: Gfo/Idh/MocA family oxidoreductase, partial [Armatimonadota bacterium]|nr:Gfo/Idh/MocA family oxidoreductase [Armatimonadota bacterium]
RHGAFGAKYDISGDAGAIVYSAWETQPLRVDLRETFEGKVGVQVPSSPVLISPYYLELEHFLNCLETGRQPDITPLDGLKAVEIGVAALKSIETGKPVTLA